MKTFAILAFVALAVVAVSGMDMDKINQECMQKEGATSEEMAGLRSGAVKPADASQNAKCFTRCAMDRAGFLKNGAISEEAINQAFSNSPMKQQMSETLQACKDMKGANDCDTAFKIIGCFAQHKTSLL